MSRNYKQNDIKLLWARSGGVCAYSDCCRELVVRETNDIIGQMAHIIPLGPKENRYDRAYPDDKKNSYENLILLCPTHHTEVDAGKSTVTAEQLRAMKTRHEEWVQNVLQSGTPWRPNFSQLHYINIPRLSILAAMLGHEIDLPLIDSFDYLHNLGFAMNKVVLKYGQILWEITPQVTRLDDIAHFDRGHVGATILFDSAFRTKNVPGPSDLASFSMSGTLEEDPHIYRQHGTQRLVLSIDPKWITTVTAFVNLRPSGGQGHFLGLCTVKDIMQSQDLVLATPLVLGS